MRWFTLSMLVFAMSVLGCKSSPWNKSQGGGAGPNSPPPTNGKFWEDQPNSSPSTNNIPATNLKLGTPSPNAAELDGVFAGRVVDNFDRPVPNTFLRVSLVDPKNPNAPPKGVGVSTNPEGYFFIQGLNAGQTYTLAAQSKDGDRPLGGVAQARPPNTRLLIRISENNFSSVVVTLVLRRVRTTRFRRRLLRRKTKSSPNGSSCLPPHLRSP